MANTVRLQGSTDTQNGTTTINEVEKAIQNRPTTHNSIYSDIGLALDKFSTTELVDYYINTLGCESSLRYYLEQQIIANEINKLKEV